MKMFGIWRVLLALSISVPVIAAEPKPVTFRDTEDQAEENALKRATLLAVARKHAEAVAALDPIIDAHDRIAAGEKRRIFSARTLAEAKRYAGGDVAVNTDVVIMPASWGLALFLKGNQLIDLKRMEDAKTFLDRAVAWAPSNSMFLSELAEWFRRNGQFDEALATFKVAEKAAELAPDESKNEERARALRGMGWILVEQGQLDEGEALFKESLKFQPDNQIANSELEFIARQRVKTTN